MNRLSGCLKVTFYDRMPSCMLELPWSTYIHFASAFLQSNDQDAGNRATTFRSVAEILQLYRLYKRKTFNPNTRALQVKITSFLKRTENNQFCFIMLLIVLIWFCFGLISDFSFSCVLDFDGNGFRRERS